jgi:hypothetical protein
MKTNALALSLILILVPLAGCAGSDGEVNIDLTTEEIQELIDDNIDDFLNNTTVTVNQQNNNTSTSTSNTTVNHINNTIIQQPSTFRSKSGTMIGLETVDNYPVGMALLVRGDRYDSSTAGNSAAGLNGANICVGIGSWLEGELQDWFSTNSIDFTSVPVADAAEATQKFRDGECDAMAIGSVLAALDLEQQLEDDSTWTAAPSEGIWVAEMFSGGQDSPGLIGNSASINIEQHNDEYIAGLIYLHLQVDLIGTCSGNSSDCENFTVTYFPGWIELNTSCSHGVSFFWSSDITGDPWDNTYDRPWGQFEGHGLNCTHSINFGISQYTANIEGYDSSSHGLSWGEWVYSAIWESIPIEQEN